MSEDSWAFNITPKNVEDFQKAHGKQQTRHIFAIMGKHHDFYQAVSTKLGQELLKDMMAMMDTVLLKIADGTATPEETMEYRILKRIFDTWCQRIKIYEVHAQKFVQG